MSVVNLSETKERALNVVLNNQEAQGRYDPDKLADLLEEMRDLPEFAFTGFDPAMIAALRFTPAETAAVEQGLPGRVEVTILADEEAYPAFATRLDELVREFDLVTHIKRVS